MTTAGLRAEYIWCLPEVGDASLFGGYMSLAVAIPDGATGKIQWVQGNHLGTPQAMLYNGLDESAGHARRWAAARRWR